MLRVDYTVLSTDMLVSSARSQGDIGGDIILETSSIRRMNMVVLETDLCRTPFSVLDNDEY